MPLKDRLARLQTQTGSGLPSPAASPEVSALRSRLSKIKTERLHSQPPLQVSRLSDEELARRLDGRLIAEGVIQIQRRFPLSGKLGKVNLADCLQHPSLPGETDSDNRRSVYLDTETTGLSGGSGTMIFLIGIATVDEVAIELHQFLLTRFSGETEFLSTFADALTPMDELVSYNGKSYDLPLLVSRFRMQGLAHTFGELPHLDLLYPVRRLFGKRWVDCRLTTLEANLLGFHRVDDLPGAQAPAAWFGYVRHGWADKLIRVVAHNQQDILSLVAAHRALAQAIERPQAFNVDLHALARWLSETDERHALELLLPHTHGLCNDSKRLLGYLARRVGDWPLAVTLWEDLAAGGCADSIERLAKYHEHIGKDLILAKHYCERLPVSVTRSHRLKRLEEKLHDTVIQSTIRYRSAETSDHNRQP